MLDSGMGDCLLEFCRESDEAGLYLLKRFTYCKNGLVKTLYPQQGPFAKLKNLMAENQKIASLLYRVANPLSRKQEPRGGRGRPPDSRRDAGATELLNQ